MTESITELVAENKSQNSNLNPWMISTLVLVGIIVGFGVGQIPGLQISGQESQTASIGEEIGGKKLAPAAAEETEPSAPILTAEQIANLADDDPVIGDAKAPITLVEFSDFQCPFCGRFFKLTFPQIEENYIKTGKVKLIYRDFPLDFHAQAMPAALAAECAHEQNHFKEMHDMIFNTQSEWTDNPKAVDLFKGFAKKLGLSVPQFNGCINNEKYALEIRKDMVDGATVGVTGTPGFFVNGKEISGAMPYEEVFKPVFDAELAGKKWELKFNASGEPSVEVK